jgi:transcriptional regulator with XRE-family HTH domain
MKLGEFLRDYRLQHDLSQRQLALICGLSNGTISNFEKGINPNTGKPITPKIEQIRKIATALGISVADLFEMIDDMPIDISAEESKHKDNVIAFTPAENKNTILIAGRDGSYQEHHLSDDQFQDLLSYLDGLQDVPDDL